MQKRFRKLISLLLALCFIFSLPVFSAAQQNFTSSLEITFLDVGQADCALISCDGHYMLIDGGNKADSQLVYSALKNRSVNKLDMVVATHPHEDHIGGIPAALSLAKADITLSPVSEFDSDAFRDFRSYAAKNGGGITVPTVGGCYSLGGASVKILGLNAAGDPNNASIILKIIHGENSFIFTGDAEREAEQAVLNSPYANELSADLLKIGHHGSENSTIYPFLRAVMPKYAVISVGSQNSYGHPTDNTLSRLRDVGATVFRTDLQGDIVCKSDGKTLSFSVSKNIAADTISTPESPVYERYESFEKDEIQYELQITKSEDIFSDYILNKNTKKFHHPYCRSVKQMKESNKIPFSGSRDEVIYQGYSPCKNCSP